MSEWKECKLDDVAGVQTGPFGSQLHNKDYVEYGTPIITVEHLGNRKISRQNLPCVSDKDKARLVKYSLEYGDLVFSRVGSVDRCSFVSKDEHGWLFSGRCLRVRSDNTIMDNNFLYYYFCTETIKETVRRIAVGATMPSINTELLSNLIIQFPPLPEQKAIASVLSSLDDKIDLLHRQNKTLEAMAEILFRQWFVEEADEDWEEGIINQLVSIQNGFAFKSSDFKENGINGVIKIKNISGGIIDIDNTDFVENSVIQDIDNRFKIRTGDILIAMTGAEIGKLGIIPNTNKGLWLNQRVGMLKEKFKGAKYLAYLQLKSEFGQDYIENTATGSAQPNISSIGIENCNFPISNSSFVKNCALQIDEFYYKVIFNLGQIRTLEKLRNTLLPKLMSGGVRVTV